MGGKSGSGGEWQLQYPGSPAGDAPKRPEQPQQRDGGDDRTMMQAPRQSRPDPGGGVKTPPAIAQAVLVQKPTLTERLKNAGKYGAMGMATPGTLIAGATYGAMTAKGKRTPLGNAAGTQGSLLSDNDDEDTSPTSADLNDFSF